MHTILDQKIPFKKMTYDRWLIAIIGLCLLGFSAISGILGLAEILGYNLLVYLFAGTLESSKIAGVIALRRLKAPPVVQAYLKVFIPVLVIFNMAASFSILSKYMQDHLNITAQTQNSQDLAQTRYADAKKALADLTAERTQALNQLPSSFTIGRVRLMNAYANQIHDAQVHVEQTEDEIQIAKSVPITRTSLSQIAETFHVSNNTVQNIFLVLLVMVFDPMGITLFAATIPATKTTRNRAFVTTSQRSRGRSKGRNRLPSPASGMITELPILASSTTLSA
jgi:hypothetical protein